MYVRRGWGEGQGCTVSFVMPRWRTPLIQVAGICLIVGLSAGCGGSSTFRLGPPPDPAVAVQEITISLDLFAERLSAGDVEGALDLASQNVHIGSTFSHPFGDGYSHAYNKNQSSGYLSGLLGRYDSFTVEFTVLEVDVDGESARAKVRFEFSGVPDAEHDESPAMFTLTVTCSFSYEYGEWLLLELGTTGNGHQEGAGESI
jgi:hypothetical protein